MIGRARHLQAGLGQIDSSPTTQGIRLVDVFVLGPFMIWAGLQTGTLPKLARAALVGAGAATVAYNGTRYLSAKP